MKIEKESCWNQKSLANKKGFIFKEATQSKIQLIYAQMVFKTIQNL